MVRLLKIVLMASLMGSGCASADPREIFYSIVFQPDDKLAKVNIEIPDAAWLKEVDFNIADYAVQDIASEDVVERSEKRLIWRPRGKAAQLSYRIAIDNRRGDQSYDALIHSDWVLMRGDDLVPPARVRVQKNTETKAYMTISLPDGWSSANTGWPRDGSRFVIDDPERSFDRPTGWLIAGKLATRHEQLEGTQLSVSGPQGHDYRPMEILAFVGMVWPHLVAAMPRVPEKILVTGAGDPMWRGGLSAGNSIYLHSDRPLVSENGTSTIIHELIHVVTTLDAASGHDWIVEGLAEFYSVELLFRAGAFNQARRDSIVEGLIEWSRPVKSLIKKHSTGPTTARAFVLFNALNEELRAQDANLNMDDFMAAISQYEQLDLDKLKVVFQELTGNSSTTLNSKVLESI